MFSLGDENEFKGWTLGDTWNGFECPYFEEAEAERICDTYNGARVDGPNGSIAYVFNEENDEEHYQVLQINTTDGPKKV